MQSIFDFLGPWFPPLAFVIALLGWAFTFWHGRVLTARTAHLDRINRQLRDLYGPLTALLLARAAAWETFEKKYWPAHRQATFFHPDYENSEEENARWRTWRTIVFHPINEAIEKTILGNMDLVEGDVPDCFVSVLAHIATYRVVLHQWSKGDYSEHHAAKNFPFEDLFNHVGGRYAQVHAIQQSLLARS